MRFRRLFALAALIITTLGVAAQPPQMNLQPKTINLDTWEFSQDGENWQTVNIPHDWAISGPFDKKWDLQTVAIVQNGEEEATEKSGRSGSLPWIGEGWYKTTISVGDPRPQGGARPEGEPRPEGMPEGPRPEGMPEGPRPEGMPEGPRPQGGPRPDGPRGPQMYAELQFDGAMSEPTVYVNGQEAGHWAYGYNAFRLDVSELIRPGENEIMVHLQNVEESSRWYPGAGLYRPVALRLTNKQHIDQWATFVSTEKLEPSYSIINVRANVCNATRTSTLAMKIRDDRGRLVKNQTFRLGEWEEGVQFLIARPRVWSPEEPRLYTLELTASDGRGVVDNQTLKFGIRTVNVSAEKGFELNGVSR